MNNLVEEVRSDIPFLETKIVYLDNAATTPTPKPVIEAMEEYFYDYNANIGRGLHEAGKRATEAFESTRGKIAEVIGGKPAEIAYTKNTTEALNLIARGLDLNEGDKIIATALEHHSNLIPWQRLRLERGIDLEVVEEISDGVLDPSAIERTIDENTAIITMPWISNALGTKQPVNEIGRIAREKDVLFCIDAAQAVGNMSVDVEEVDCDFLAAPGHKGLLGPQGTGFLYVKEKHMNRVEPLLYGGGMVKSADELTCEFVDPPQVFDAGTPNIPGIIGLGRAAEYILDIGTERIEKRERKLVKKMLNIDEIEGVEVYGPKSEIEMGGAISFDVEGMDSHEVSSLLDELEDIATRSGHHCAIPALQQMGLEETVRASVHYYNTEKEVEKFMDTLNLIASELGG